MIQSLITGTGAYIPTLAIPNEDFLSSQFYNPDQTPVSHPTETTIRKFAAITGIQQRRYAAAGMTASLMGLEAARQALDQAQINPEKLDQIIVAHNYGDMAHNGAPRDQVPSLAARMKQGLGIKNPYCIAYDLIFGCPSWLLALMQADQAIRSGVASSILVIGTETLSRVIDASDRDAMIFADGAGACILTKTDSKRGFLNSIARSDTQTEASFIYSQQANDGSEESPLFIKMKGHKVYEYALREVPPAMKKCLDESGRSIDELKMIFIHQANEKMDEAILREFYTLYGKTPPDYVMPMNISWMGNSSVATIPTLLHQVLTGELEHYQLHPNDLILLASVGAGMHINAVVYQL
ncbi:ketoacyl-ACP synthase III [Siphonobacter sp. SORGH_AS_0500]|uniref:3-oxoacyl-ACP synthase III family protein n=1 Tax=Siphonobacter sp. SORGH_AS_0500 TaxID=1864824 RepID=UPI002857D2AF|nr:ketoacyl-ACP synthase III [Siphonobacter sp. SORGH_AS_0500]MDR6198073.1 3-oxoacyl-[acyl-carrier-protein] synthase-3 [Siphonobacter sp. SORGH_AS_0500]